MSTNRTYLWVDDQLDERNVLNKVLRLCEAEATIGLMNLTYNLFRSAQLKVNLKNISKRNAWS